MEKMRNFFKVFTSKNKFVLEGKKVNPLAIKKGDVFRIEEYNGKPVKFNGCEYYIAHKNVKKMSIKNGYCSIACFELNKSQLEKAAF